MEENPDKQCMEVYTTCASVCNEYLKSNFVSGRHINGNDFTHCSELCNTQRKICRDENKSLGITRFVYLKESPDNTPRNLRQE